MKVVCVAKKNVKDSEKFFAILLCLKNPYGNCAFALILFFQNPGIKSVSADDNS